MLFHPRLDKWDEHFIRPENAPFEIHGQTPTGRATVRRLQLNEPTFVAVRRELATLQDHGELDTKWSRVLTERLRHRAASVQVVLLQQPIQRSARDAQHLSRAAFVVFLPLHDLGNASFLNCGQRSVVG